MKKTAIIKASLASLVISTGLLTSTAQASEISILRHTLGLDEQSKQTQQVAPESKVETATLLNYYNQSPFELKNVTGYTENGNKLSFTPSNAGQTTVTLSSSKFSEFDTSDTGNPGLDVFVVRENSDRGTTDSSIGGVTKSDKTQYKDTLKTAYINVKTTENYVTKDETLKDGISFNKKEISLKELDFKLRKLLIDQKGLYNGSYSSGEIKVHTNNNGLYTFELHKKLQDNRMSDVINSTDIKHIEVTLTK